MKMFKVIRNTEKHITVRYHLTSISLAELRKRDGTKCWGEFGDIGLGARPR